MRLPKQFSLRAMGALVLLVCVLLASWVSDSKEQQSATKAVRGFGGRVIYEEPPSLVPHFIIRGLGHDYICGVESITLYPTAVADADNRSRFSRNFLNYGSLQFGPVVPGSRRHRQTRPAD